MQNETILVRVQKTQIRELREIFPDLQSEDNTTLVRIALNRFLQEGKKGGGEI